MIGIQVPHDPFEESLREMLRGAPGGAAEDEHARLGRVLKTANRQLGAGDLFSLLGQWPRALLIAINGGLGHASTTSRRRSTSRPAADKAD